MKVLCVAHPDDEIIWFNPGEFDNIVIVFGAREDKPWMEKARHQVLSEHLYRERIIFLGLPESGYWKNSQRFYFHQKTHLRLTASLKKLDNLFMQAEAIFTHNSSGEYGHADHILVHDVIKQLFYYQKNIPIWVNCLEAHDVVSETNIDDFKLIKSVYQKHSAWTWRSDYFPETVRYYRRLR